MMFLSSFSYIDLGSLILKILNQHRLSVDEELNLQNFVLEHFDGRRYLVRAGF